MQNIQYRKNEKQIIPRSNKFSISKTRVKYLQYDKKFKNIKQRIINFFIENNKLNSFGFHFYALGF